MTITLRSAKGSPLTHEELDGNFTDLDGRVTELEENPPTGVGIASITVLGNTFTVNMTDASVQGPFFLPAVDLDYREDWAPDTAYAVNNFFRVANDGIYLVLQDFVSGTEFEPDAENTEGPLLDKLMPLETPNTAVNIITVSDEDVILNDAATYRACYIAMDSADAHQVVILSEASMTGETFNEGDTLTVHQDGAGQVSFIGETAVEIRAPASTNLRQQYSGATLVYRGGDVWDLNGDLELL